MCQLSRGSLNVSLTFWTLVKFSILGAAKYLYLIRLSCFASNLTIVAPLHVESQELEPDDGARRLRDEVGALPVARVRVGVVRRGDDAARAAEFASAH